jgi:hypothetical protein
MGMLQCIRKMGMLLGWARQFAPRFTRHCAGALLISQRIPVRLGGARRRLCAIVGANFFLKPVEPPRTVTVLPDFAHCQARIAELANGGSPQTP